MSSTFGNIIKISLFGESHGSHIGMVIDGLPAGIKIDLDYINKELRKRRPSGNISTARQEEDKITFISGVFSSRTTGSPVTFIIPNNDTHSASYKDGVVRPSHADYVANVKYDGFNDYRGGGHFSGRITASLVVLGAICRQELESYNIKVGTHIENIGDFKDLDFDYDNLEKQIDSLNDKIIALNDSSREDELIKLIENVKLNKDSIGGSLKTVAINLPVGIGEPYFNGLDAYISHLVLSIGGVKGIIFGDVDFTTSKGSQVNDEMQYINGNVCFKSNHAGGVYGGISSSMPLMFKTIVKPTPSIGLQQNSIDINNKENISLQINGRHDPCIVHRIRSVVDAITCYAIYDLLLLRKARSK